MISPVIPEICETVYRQFHHKRFVSPDPLEIVLRYESVLDREIAAFIASSLALGRVDGILRASSWILSRLPGPRAALIEMDEAEIVHLCTPFRYRFFTGENLAGLLIGLKGVLAEYDTLEKCFTSGLPSGAGAGTGRGVRTIAGLSALVSRVRSFARGRLDGSIMIARPDLGSACKRLLLFMRWMVRRDAVDPGGWTAVSPADLLVPVDTHMLRVCRWLGLTSRTTGSIRVSMELTGTFSSFVPEDPTKYDFSLTRLGIHPEGRLSEIRHAIEHGHAQSKLTFPA